jgi:hypothetical protein
MNRFTGSSLIRCSDDQMIRSSGFSMNRCTDESMNRSAKRPARPAKLAPNSFVSDILPLTPLKSKICGHRPPQPADSKRSTPRPGGRGVPEIRRLDWARNRTGRARLQSCRKPSFFFVIPKGFSPEESAFSRRAGCPIALFETRGNRGRGSWRAPYWGTKF